MNRVTRDWLKQVAIALSWFFLFSWFDWLAVLGRRPSKKDGLLLVKLDAIGDFVLTSPILVQLIRKEGTDSVTLACDARNVSIACAMFPEIRVIGVDTKRFLLRPFYRWRILGSVAAIGASRAINVALSHEIWWGDSIVRTSGAPDRQGIRGYADRVSDWLLPLCYSWYTKIVPLSGIGGFVVLEIQAGLKELGHELSDLKAPSFYNTAKSKGPMAPYFVMAPGSLRATKQWPPERFAEIASRLHARTGWRGVLLGAPGDVPAINEVAEIAPEAVINLAGQTSLMEAVATVADAKLLIANDSALVHIAAIHGVPTVATLGGGHPGRFLPYPPQTIWLGEVRAVSHPMPCQNCDWRCIYPIGDTLPAPCITGISADAMWSAIVDVAGLHG